MRKLYKKPLSPDAKIIDKLFRHIETVRLRANYILHMCRGEEEMKAEARAILEDMNLLEKELYDGRMATTPSTK